MKKLDKKSFSQKFEVQAISEIGDPLCRTQIFPPPDINYVGKNLARLFGFGILVTILFCGQKDKFFQVKSTVIPLRMFCVKVPVLMTKSMYFG